MENFITKVKINNVRHLRDIEIKLPEDKRTHLILTGRNGSGKTSVMEALKVYLSRYTENAMRQSEIEARELDINRKREILEEDNKDEFSKLKIEDRLETRKKLFYEYYKGAETEFNNLNEVKIKSVRGEFIVASYEDERRFKAKNETMINKVKLKKQYELKDKPGKDFVKYLLDLKATEAMAEKNGKPERAKEISEWFQRFDSILKKIFNNNEVKLEFNFETYEFHIYEPNKKLFSFSELSSGYAAVLDIVTDLMMRMEKNYGKNYDVEGVVLIDEIDAHLHIELQRKILPFLTELFPNIQFIVSTHSPYIVTSISNAVIYDLEKKVQFNDMSGYAVDIVAEGYFEADNYSIQIKEMIKRFEELSEKVDITDEERAERAELRSKLEDVPGNLGLYIQSIIENIEWNGQIG